MQRKRLIRTTLIVITILIVVALVYFGGTWIVGLISEMHGLG